MTVKNQRALAMLQNCRGLHAHIEKLAMLLLVAATFYQVLIPPAVGLANNGDFERIISQVGLSYYPFDISDKYFSYIHLQFDTGVTDPSSDTQSLSAVLLVRGVLTVNDIISKDGLFDLRLLGAFYSVGYLCCLLSILRLVRRLPTAARWTASLLILVVFSDVGYVQYFNSLYAEPAAFLYLMITLSCGLHYIRRPQINSVLIFAYFSSALLFVLAKTQYVPQVVPLVAFGVLVSRGSTDWWFRYGRIIFAGSVVLIAAWSATLVPQPIQNVNLYDNVFMELLPHSSSPQDDLRDLGLDEALAQWTGTNAFEPGVPIDEPQFKEDFFDQISYVSLAKWYATHPRRFVSLLNRSVSDGGTLSVSYLGNFEKATGRQPVARSKAFDTWDGVRGSIGARSFTSLILASSFASLGALFVWVRSQSAETKRYTEFFLMLVVMAAIELVSVCLGAPSDINKHLVLFNMIVDMSLIFALSAAALWASRFIRLAYEGTGQKGAG